MAGNFELTVDGGTKAEIAIRGIAGRKDKVQRLVNRAAIAAAVTMKTRVPNSPKHRSTGGFERAIGWQRAEWRPGGAGGGGAWVAHAGVQPTPETTTGLGTSNKSSGVSYQGYPTHVFRGTGIYGPTGQPIIPRTGNVMVIDGYKPRDLDRGFPLKKPRSGPIFTRYVKGQLPQTAWFEAGQERATQIIAANLHRVFHANDPIDDI